MRSRLLRGGIGGMVFEGVNGLLLICYALLSILPFVYIIAGSFATENELLLRPFFLFPHEPSINAFRFIFSSDTIMRALMVSVLITVVGTAVNLAFTVPMAYSLSKRYLAGRSGIMKAVIFSMLFGGGIIPTYLVVRTLGLLDSYWSLWLTGAISPFNLMVIKNFFQEMPVELEESARIDGAPDLTVLWKIVIPLSMPVMATFSLFYAVGHWNAFFGALLYLNRPKMWPLQVILRNLVLLSQGMVGDRSALESEFVEPPEQAIKMAVIVVGTVPILMVYPFLQRYFVKGVLLGSLKQ